MKWLLRYPRHRSALGDCAFVLFFVITLFPSASRAGTVELTGTADSDGRWYELASDVFVRLDQSTGSGSGTIYPPFLISELPAFVSIPAGENTFPNGTNFDLGSLEYDETGLTGVGSETASIVSLTLDVQSNVADGNSVLGLGNGGSSVTSVRWIDSASQVTLLDGVVQSVFLAASVRLAFANIDEDSGLSQPEAFYDGTFTIFGSRFDLYVDGTWTSVGGDNQPVTIDFCTGEPATLRYIWDFKGTIDHLTSIPFPEVEPEFSFNMSGHPTLTWAPPAGVPPMFVYMVQSNEDLGEFPWPQSGYTIADCNGVNLSGFTIYGRGAPGSFEGTTWSDTDLSLPSKRFYRLVTIFAPRPSAAP
ncbi:MAG: hypothetical protein AAGD22_04335 [Verrucomicrobiota bacterium]